MIINELAIKTTDDIGAEFETRLWKRTDQDHKVHYYGEQRNLIATTVTERVETQDFRELIDWLYEQCGFERPVAIVFATNAMQLLVMSG